MSIVLTINVKGASKKINQLDYEYDWQDGEQITIREFLNETVAITFNKYKEAVIAQNKNETDNQDFVTEKNDKLVNLLKVLSNDEIEEKAQTGKVSFGIHYNLNLITDEKAKENARQCFEDGLVTLFIDEERYERLDDVITVHNRSQVTFVKMVFLAGRMW